MKIVSQIAKILFEEDPCGIGEIVGNPYRDEYDLEAQDIVRVLDECKTEEELNATISDIFTKWFSKDSFGNDALRKATTRIFKLKENPEEIKINYKDVVLFLIHEIPEFKPIYLEHIKDYGEVLLHVLFGDFTRFVVDAFHKSEIDSEGKKKFLRSLDFIEELFDSDDEKLSELAQVSFVENLDKLEIDGMKKYFRKETLKSAERVWRDL